MRSVSCVLGRRVLTLCIFIPFISQGQVPLQWVNVTTGKQIPANALVGGEEATGEKLYVAIAYYNNTWQPAKTRTDWNFASTEFGGKEVNVTNYKVLIKNQEFFWQHVPAGVFYSNAVAANDKRSVFFCRGQYQGSTQVGVTWDGLKSCAFGYGGKTVYVESYSLLFYAPDVVSVASSGNNSTNTQISHQNNSSTTRTKKTERVNPNYLNHKITLQSITDHSKYLQLDSRTKSFRLEPRGAFPHFTGVFELVNGLDQTENYTVSFKTGNQYLVLKNDLLTTSYNDNTETFFKTASFKRYAGLSGKGNSYESVHKPGYYLAIQNNELVLVKPENDMLRQAAGFSELYRERKHKSVSIRSVADTTLYWMVNNEKQIVALPVTNTNKYLSEFLIGSSTDVTNCIGCISFTHRGDRVSYYAYAYNYMLKADGSAMNTSAFRTEAAFLTRPGLSGKGFSYESLKFPGFYLKLVGNMLVLAPIEQTEKFKREATFEEVKALYTRLNYQF